jgi:hypothetical protein
MAELGIVSATFFGYLFLPRAGIEDPLCNSVSPYTIPNAHRIWGILRHNKIVARAIARSRDAY